MARTAGHVRALAGMVADLGPEELAWGIAEQVTREGGVTDTRRKASPNVLVTMYRDERRQLVDVCRIVAGLDLEERRERRAERQAAQFATVLRLLLADLALSPEQQAQVPAALRTAVAALAAHPARTGPGSGHDGPGHLRVVTAQPDAG